jgi:dTDP-4-dehydrorhamnose 3,5-epimerase
VLIDTRDASPTEGAVVQVPNVVYDGWQCISLGPSPVVNVPNELYDREDPHEFRIEPHDSVPYDWTRNDG